MKNRPSKILAAALLGGLLFTTAHAAGLLVEPILTDHDFSPPAPVFVVAPMNIPRDYQNETVRLSLTVDEQGRARRITLLGGQDPRLLRHLLPAVAQWQFKPALKHGRPVSAAVVLPVQLVESAGF